jgi:hypothetical protein
MQMGCIVCQKQAHDVDGYIRTKVHEREEAYGHHLALLISGRRDELALLASSTNYDVRPQSPLRFGSPSQTNARFTSQVCHRCHTRSCIAPAHLVVSTKQYNNDCNSCQGRDWQQCPCPCGTWFSPCVHTPSCILPKPPAARHLGVRMWPPPPYLLSAGYNAYYGVTPNSSNSATGVASNSNSNAIDISDDE